MSSANLIENGAALQRFGAGLLKASGAVALNGATPVVVTIKGLAPQVAYSAGPPEVLFQQGDTVLYGIREVAGTPAAYTAVATANTLTLTGTAGDTSVIWWQVWGFN